MVTDDATAVCQSCSMPLAKPEDHGTEADGSHSDEYCTYCYQGGSFTAPDATLDDMVGTLVGFSDRPEGEAREESRAQLTPLKRWRVAR
jgi:hypothetical protein